MPVQLSSNPYGFGCAKFFHQDYVQSMPAPLSEQGADAWFSQQHGYLVRDPERGILWYRKAEADVEYGRQDVEIHGLTLNGSRFLENATLALNKRLIEEVRPNPKQVPHRRG
jgi:hypothetical protein